VEEADYRKKEGVLTRDVYEKGWAFGTGIFIEFGWREE